MQSAHPWELRIKIDREAFFCGHCLQQVGLVLAISLDEAYRIRKQESALSVGLIVDDDKVKAAVQLRIIDGCQRQSGLKLIRNVLSHLIEAKRICLDGNNLGLGTGA